MTRTSTELLYPVLPVFLTQVLNTGGSVVGLIEGAAEATQHVVQGISGWLSDRTRAMKPIAVSGYGAYRGTAFGLEGFGDTFGAFLGPLLAVLLLRTFQVGLRTIFYIAVIPGAVLAASFAVFFITYVGFAMARRVTLLALGSTAVARRRRTAQLTAA